LTSIDGELTWQDVEWLRSITKLPVLVKGILTAEDGENRVVITSIPLPSSSDFANLFLVYVRLQMS